MNAATTLMTDPSWAVARTVHQLFQFLDDGQFEQMAALFAVDGVWVRQGQNLTGPSAVLQAMLARPKGLATRHLVTNLITHGTRGVIEARYYATVFAHVGEITGPAPLSTPESIFICEDRLIETPEGWLFARRTPRHVFKRA